MQKVSSSEDRLRIGSASSTSSLCRCGNSLLRTEWCYLSVVSLYGFGEEGEMDTYVATDPGAPAHDLEGCG